MDEQYRFKVWHPKHGEVEVTASDRYWALVTASREWDCRWTTIAKDCVITDLGVAPKKTRKEKRHGNPDKKKPRA